jgi:DNA gyrase/topoisomerase IV subunit A
MDEAKVHRCAVQKNFRSRLQLPFIALASWDSHFGNSVLKTARKIGKVTINLVDDTTELMVISQFGKIIRIDTKSIRAAGRSTSASSSSNSNPRTK